MCLVYHALVSCFRTLLRAEMHLLFVEVPTLFSNGVRCLLNCRDLKPVLLNSITGGGASVVVISSPRSSSSLWLRSVDTLRYAATLRVGNSSRPSQAQYDTFFKRRHCFLGALAWTPVVSSDLQTWKIFSLWVQIRDIESFHMRRHLLLDMVKRVKLHA